MNTPDYPRPTVTETNRPLLEGWQEGRLLLQHCGDCDTKFYFPRPFCPKCWSESLQWREHGGQGHIVAFTRVHRHVHEAFRAEGPTVFAEIQLIDGPSLLARCVGDKPPQDGASVRLVPAAEASRYPLPTFTLA